MKNIQGTVRDKYNEEPYGPEGEVKNTHKSLNPRKTISVHEKVCLKSHGGLEKEEEEGSRKVRSIRECFIKSEFDFHSGSVIFFSESVNIIYCLLCAKICKTPQYNPINKSCWLHRKNIFSLTNSH